MAGNRPARERFDFSLDARQVAGVTLGSLGALALAFLLGNATGQRMAERPLAPPRPAATAASAPVPADPLAALDQAPRPDGGEPPVKLTSQDDLVRPGPGPDRLPPGPKYQPQPAPKVPPSTAVAPSSGPSGPAVQAAAAAPAPASANLAAPPAAQAAPSVPVAVPAGPPAAPAAKPAAGKGAWVVQIGSTQERFEADRIAARHVSRGARVTVADVPGKGRWYRVRLGAFDTREAADRYLKDLERSTGAKGFVASNN